MRVAAACLLLCACSSAPAESPVQLPTPLLDVAWMGTPTSWRATTEVCVDGDGPQLAVARVAEQANRVGLPLVTSSSCGWRLRFVTSLPALDAAAQKTWNAAPPTERFVLINTLDGDGLATDIFAPSDITARWAVDDAFVTTAARADGRLVPQSTIIDWPALPLRGVTEGFYGQPFSTGGRAALLYQMAELRQNTYVYAPQNDDDTHATWWQLYDAGTLAGLAQSAQIARGYGIDFVWGVRPGQSLYYPSAEPIMFSSVADFTRLTTKLMQLHDAGVHSFGLFFDDDGTELTWPADIQAYPSLVAAQISLTNRLADWLTALDPTANLYFIGTDYSEGESGWQVYNVQLSTGLHSAIRVFWTGDVTHSPTITTSDLMPVAESLQRTPVIWDNWPQTLEAVSGRDPQLGMVAGGMVTNPVICSWEHATVGDFIDVDGTAGMYAWRTSSYDPVTALARWRIDELSIDTSSLAP